MKKLLLIALMSILLLAYGCTSENSTAKQYLDSKFEPELSTYLSTKDSIDGIVYSIPSDSKFEYDTSRQHYSYAPFTVKERVGFLEVPIVSCAEFEFNTSTRYNPLSLDLTVRSASGVGHKASLILYDNSWDNELYRTPIERSSIHGRFGKRVEFYHYYGDTLFDLMSKHNTSNIQVSGKINKVLLTTGILNHVKICLPIRDNMQSDYNLLRDKYQQFNEKRQLVVDKLNPSYYRPVFDELKLDTIPSP